tara:strand:- start:1343 stop:2719 length:1377 start_codon:yes stop_codon:yes gene_type:complete
MKRIIFAEINEVPKEVFESGFLTQKEKKLLNQFEYIPTISNDIGHLSPWTTWATVHRGVIDKFHGIIDINQDVSEIDKLYPTITSELSNKGYKVGVFGSLHSANISQDEFKKYDFFVPESFANSAKCKPNTVLGIQKFNLLMSRKSARIVDKSLPSISILIAAVKSYLIHSRNIFTMFQVFFQLVDEIFRPWVKVRRRSIQSIILFDIYLNLLKTNNSEFSTFFTNHVASNMHRFWEAKFPNHYPKNINSKQWINRYKKEIDYSMKITIGFIKKLAKYIERDPDAELWILSSMGQEAVLDYKTAYSYWKIIDLNQFINSLCQKKIDVEELPQMIPHYSLKSDQKSIEYIAEKINFLETNSNISIRSKTNNTLAFYFDSYNLDELIFKDPITNKAIDIKGISKLNIDENTGSSAYHMPYGVLYRYGKNMLPIQKSELDINGYLPTDKIKNLVEKILSRD